jgi:hypothetical protein
MIKHSSPWVTPLCRLRRQAKITDLNLHGTLKTFDPDKEKF